MKFQVIYDIITLVL